MTHISGRIALVTGANRGIGKSFVDGLLARGAEKVYATARDASTVDASDPRVVALQLDVTDPESVRRAATEAPDVSILVNNAGIEAGSSLLDPDQTLVRREFDTNFFGALSVASAFTEALVENHGVLLNVHSVLSWISLGGGGYPSTKAALWSATNSIRTELAPQGVQVVGLHVGLVATDLGNRFEGDKTQPTDVVAAALDGVESGAWEVLVDEVSRQVKSGLSAPIEVLYPALVEPATV